MAGIPQSLEQIREDMSGVDRQLVELMSRRARLSVSAGGLHHAIEVFARRDIDMTRIESRPSRQERWSYVFYVDVEGHRDEPLVAEALDELRTRVEYLKIVGSFPRALKESSP